MTISHGADFESQYKSLHLLVVMMIVTFSPAVEHYVTPPGNGQNAIIWTSKQSFPTLPAG